jgi:excisionase family DNA binding protein
MDLISKRQAAELLSLSTRGIERAVRRGHLAVEYRNSKHGRKAWFKPADLERYRRHQELRGPVGFIPGVPPQQPPGTPTIGTLVPMVEIPRSRKPAREQRETNPVSLSDRLTLTLKEASHLSGLPKRFLEAKIREGKLKALSIGRSTFVKRAELEEFVREL